MVVRLFKAVVKVAFYSVLFLVVLAFLPMKFDFQPEANTVELPEFKGALSRNNKLDSVEYLFKDQLIGPESLPVYEGSIYTGTVGGEIFKITGDKLTLVTKLGKECEGLWEEEVCGRPLGMRFNKQGKLYVIDAYYGLYVVNVTTGESQCLLPASTPVEGKKIVFGDDIELDDDGSVYITEASNKWPLKKLLFTVIELESTGRVLKFNPKTRETTVLAKGLRLPNGIQFTHDKKALLVCELTMRRILKLHLSGAKKGQTEVFADNLPGEPDNIRLNKRGTYWVGFALGRSNDSILLGDVINRYPLVKKSLMRLLYLAGSALTYATSFYPNPALKDIAAQVSNGWVLYKILPKYGFVAELDAAGRIVRSLHSPQHKIHILSEVLEHDGYLYLGSYRNPFLGRVKL